MNAREIDALIQRHRFRFVDEEELQDSLVLLFENSAIKFEREVRLWEGDRLDFLVDGIAIEVKIQGQKTSLIQQLLRYARHDRVHELLVVTSKRRLCDLPASLGAKPVHVAYVSPL